MATVYKSMFPGLFFLTNTGTCTQPLPKRQIMDCSKLEDFADDNSKLDENDEKVSKRVLRIGGGWLILLKQNSHFINSLLV